MAINKKQAAKPAKKSKTVSVKTVKAAPVSKKVAEPTSKKSPKAPAKPAAKKTVAQNSTSKKKAPVAKPAAKKTVTPKKVVNKAAPSKPANKKASPATKEKIKSKATTINLKTVDKKNSKPAPTATKSTTAKKAAPAPKAASAAKKVAAAPEKAPAKKTVEKPEVKKVATPEPVAAKKPSPTKAEPAKAKTATKSVPTKTIITKQPVAPTPKPTPTPAARSTEKKPQVIIAHRKLENKSKQVKQEESAEAPYQPETYRSILDEAPAPAQQQTTVYRYSDEELNEFKQLIQGRLEAARKELHYLQGLITRKDEAGTDDTENRFMNMEDGSGAMEREQLAQLASRQIQFMNHLEKALVRIENKTYGVCRVTGKLIDKARLRAVPHATLSIEAKNMMSANKH